MCYSVLCLEPCAVCCAACRAAWLAWCETRWAETTGADEAAAAAAAHATGKTPWTETGTTDEAAAAAEAKAAQAIVDLNKKLEEAFGDKSEDFDIKT